MLGLKLKKELKIILLIFSVVATTLVGYYYFIIYKEIHSLKSITLTLQSKVNVMLSGLTKIYSLISIETLLIIVSFVAFAFAINYVLNEYFLEKRNALIDELTNVYNRKAMNIWMRKEISRSRRFKHPLSVIMMDIDHFKMYNDKNGHLRGDWLLHTIAKIFKDNTRDMDFVGRYGGEEFIILLPETEHQESLMIANRIRSTVENTKFPGGETQPKGKVTISMGLVTFHELLEEAEMIKTADQLLYQAKNSGRNMIVHKRYN